MNENNSDTWIGKRMWDNNHKLNRNVKRLHKDQNPELPAVVTVCHPFFLSPSERDQN